MRHIARVGGHAHVLRLIEVLHTETELMLVLEYCSQGELYEIVDSQRLPEDRARTVFYQAAVGACAPACDRVRLSLASVR